VFGVDPNSLSLCGCGKAERASEEEAELVAKTSKEYYDKVIVPSRN